MFYSKLISLSNMFIILSETLSSVKPRNEAHIFNGKYLQLQRRPLILNNEIHFEGCHSRSSLHFLLPHEEPRGDHEDERTD